VFLLTFPSKYLSPNDKMLDNYVAEMQR
jgi:hypothetical protein